MNGQPQAPVPAARPHPKDLRAVYCIGVFGMGLIDVFVFLMPLYGLKIGLNAAEIGTLVGARTVLTLLFSIHIGSLMDRFGTIRVMKFFAIACIFIAPLYPMTDTFAGLLVLQILAGGAVSFGWAGAQTLIAQISKGDAEYIGRFSFASRIGTTTAPLIAGAIWDAGGVWPAYLLASGWAVILVGTIWLAPAAPVARGSKHTKTVQLPTREPLSFRDLMPRLSDYTRSFAMLAIPIVAISVAVMFLRNSTSGINNSIYVVYLDGIGMTGTMIGILFAAIEATSGIGALLGGRASRFGDPRWTMVIGTAAAIIFICITPLLGGIFALLLLAQIIRGLLQGITQPVMFSVQSKAVGAHEQGAVVGLRQTMNRLSAIIVPPVMGLIADRWGMGQSFLIVGAALLFLCGLIAVWVSRTPRMQD